MHFNIEMFRIFYSGKSSNIFLDSSFEFHLTLKFVMPSYIHWCCDLISNGQHSKKHIMNVLSHFSNKSDMCIQHSLVHCFKFNWIMFKNVEWLFLLHFPHKCNMRTQHTSVHGLSTNEQWLKNIMNVVCNFWHKCNMRIQHTLVPGYKFNWIMFIKYNECFYSTFDALVISAFNIHWCTALSSNE